MESLAQLFKAAGLTQKEAQVYLACLRLGTCSVLEVARRTKIPRSSVYLIIASLLEKGLLSKTVEGRKTRFAAVSPRKLVEMVRDRKKELEKAKRQLLQLLPQLLALAAKPGKPKVEFYEGLEEIKKIYEDTLNYPEILVFCMSQEAFKLMPKYLDSYCKRVIRREIRTKEIVSDSPQDKEYQKKYSTPRNIIRCLPQKYITNTDKMIYGNKVAFISYVKGQVVGVVIEDEEIARHERNQFKLIWSNL